MFLIGSNATESNVAHAVPVAGAITNLNVILNGTIGAAPRAYTFTVRKNSATPATTPITCQVLGPSGTTCSDNTNCMLVNAGGHDRPPERSVGEPDGASGEDIRRFPSGRDDVSAVGL